MPASSTWAPESYVGGPLAVVRTGDMISIDVEKREINLEIPEDELKRRLADWTPPKQRFPRGYTRMYMDHVTQADDGCDFDFLEYTEEDVPEPEIH